MEVTKALRGLPLGAIGITALIPSAVAAACGGDTLGTNPTVVVTTTSSTPASTPPVITSRITLTPGDPGLPIQTLAQLLQLYPNVVVGQVDGVLQPFDPRPGALGYSESQIQDLETGPKGGPIPSDVLARPPGSMSSIYSVSVLRSIAGDWPSADSVFAVMQPGGVFENVAYENEGDPVILPGSTYLFFLTPFDPSASNYRLPQGYDQLPEGYQHIFESTPEARFVVVDDHLLAVDPSWGTNCQKCEPQSLDNLSVDEAIALIQAASQGTPTPTGSSPTVTSASSDTTTPSPAATPAFPG